MRVLHYSHNTNGSEHIQRTLAIAEQVAFDFPKATQLLVTDTPQPPGVKLPSKLDFIKLPSSDQHQGCGFHDPSLVLPAGVVKALREELILNAIKHFNPDVVLVEDANGIQQEIFQIRDQLRENRSETKFIFGRGDIESTTTMIRDTLKNSTSDLSEFFSPVDAHSQEERSHDRTSTC